MNYVANKRVRDLQDAAVISWNRVQSAAREGDAMKGKSQPESAKTFGPVVCEQVGLCVGCSSPVQFALHVDVGSVDTTFFVCWPCLMRVGIEMDRLRNFCEMEIPQDAGQ